MSQQTSYEILNNSSMNLQSLQKEYDLAMTQYKQANLDYIASLESKVANGGTRIFNILPSSRFWGSSAIKDIIVNKIEECQAACAEDAKCTGATFNSSSGYCWLRTGTGEINTSTNPNEYAIMPNVSQNINNLKMLNDKLIQLNMQIMDELNRSEPVVLDEVAHKNEKKAQMEETNQQLLEERIKILELLDETQDLNVQYDTNSIYAKQSNAEYILWTIIVIMLVSFILRLALFPDSSGKDHVKFFIKIVLFFGLLISMMKMNNPAGMAIFGLLVLFLIIKIMNKINDKEGSDSGYGSRSGYSSSYSRGNQMY
jgi:hypothetical protein